LAAAKGWRSGVVDLLAITLERRDDTLQGAFVGGEAVRVRLRAKAHEDIPQPILGFTVRDRLGQELFGENTLPFTDAQPVPVQAGQEFYAEFDFTLPMLPNGEYAVMASAATGTLYDNIQHHFLHDAVVLTVTSSKIRWGLVGIPFDQVVLKVAHEQQ
jgi:lipopolysaccharide transport system ATP-binding protein